MALPAADVAPAVPLEEPARKRVAFRFLANTKAVIGLAVIGVLVVLSVIGDWIAPYDPSARSSDLLEAPSGKHWLGTTHLGQDILSQLLVGTRSVMVVGLASGIAATIVSVIVGVTAGYLGGGWDDTLSALSNVFLVIPALPTIIIVASTL